MWNGPIRLPNLSSICLFIFVVFVGSAVQAQQSCTVTPALKLRATVSIFNVEQERVLGDVEAQLVERNYPVVHDEELAAHLNTVAGHVLSLFPPDQMRVRIIRIDTPDAESFSVGPERIYVTRKMITLLSSDDESVGLLGHELGHILAHQNAVMVSQLFHEILGVNGVSDRQEVSEKFAELLGTIDRNKKMLRKAAQVMERQEAINQYEADRVALMLRLLVDFSPQAFRDLFERSSETNGRRGNLTTDFFAATTSNKRRLREINKTLKRLPKQCREIVPASSNEFRTWRAAVLSYADFAGQ